MPNPYSGELGKAWEAGWSAASRGRGRAGNPYFDAGMKAAWFDGFDARKAKRSRSRFV